MNNHIDSKDKSINETVFWQNALIAVFSILLCLVSLCSMTYAWFATEATNNGNQLASGCFDVTVKIVSNDANSMESDITSIGAGKYRLNKAGTYVVTVSPTSDTSVKGYCVVTINGTSVYRTDRILPDVNEFVFTLAIAEETTVEFTANWGIPMTCDVTNNATITVSAPSDGE